MKSNITLQVYVQQKTGSHALHLRKHWGGIWSACVGERRVDMENRMMKVCVGIGTRSRPKQPFPLSTAQERDVLHKMGNALLISFLIHAPCTAREPVLNIFANLMQSQGSAKGDIQSVFDQVCDDGTFAAWWTVPAQISRCASKRSGGTLFGRITYFKPFSNWPCTKSLCCSSLVSKRLSKSSS